MSHALMPYPVMAEHAWFHPDVQPDTLPRGLEPEDDPPSQWEPLPFMLMDGEHRTKRHGKEQKR